MKNRIISFFICFILFSMNIIGCTAPADEVSLYNIPVEFEDPFMPERTEVAFSELEGMRYDGFDEFEKSIVRMEDTCSEEGAFQELKELYEFLYGEMNKVNTTSAIASIEYDMDYQNEELAIQSMEEDSLQSEMNMLYEGAIKKVLASPYKERFSEFIGQDVAELFSDKYSDSERAAEISRKENELVMEYYQAVQQDFSVDVNDEEWTESKLYEKEDSLTNEEYYEILDAILKKKNEACVPMYLELVQLRKEAASLYGYENVAEYFYEEVYSRDYSPADVHSYFASVKKYIVPAYQAIRETKEYRSDTVIEIDNILPIMEEILPRISGEMEEIFHYMIEHEMIFLTDNFDASMNTGYTSTLPNVAQAFVYNFASSDAQGLSDTFHEFGHYCDIYLNGLYGATDAGVHLDLAEVCAMGLEMLMYEYYEEVLEGDVTDEKLERLYSFLGNIIDGCMYEEAQQRVFSYEGELTGEVVNNIFRKVAAEYGKSGTYDRGLSWVEIYHTFEVPFYYLSYATASSAAMEIWLTAKEQGQDAAVDMYLSILSRGSFEYGYSEVLDVCGMSGFDSEKYLEKLYLTIIDEIEMLLEDKEFE